MNNIKGNFTTILKYICMIIAGWAIGIAVSNGLNLPITEEQLTEIIFVIILGFIGYLDSKYPNTFSFLDNTRAEEIVRGDADVQKSKRL